MKAGYDTTDRRKRAAQYRRDAAECEAAGYPVIAEVNREMAALLEPPEPKDKECPE